MFVQSLQLTNFRNYTEQVWQPIAGINCLVGANGMGKTNLLEAIYSLAMTRGFGTDKDLIHIGENYYLAQAVLDQHPQISSVSCGYFPGKGKKMTINQQPLARLTEHIGKLPVVSVLPEDVELIRAGGSERRAWLDSLLAQADNEYFQALLCYEKVRKQRNALLQTFYENQIFSADQLENWNRPLIQYGIVIAEKRKQFLSEFQEIFTHYHRAVIPEGETPALEYQTTIQSNTPEYWQEALAKQEWNDRRLRRTGFGVHKDDVVFKVKGQLLKPYGSQGQQKTFVFALKFAQYHYFEQKTKLLPFLLLDDIFDKLDEARLARIAALLIQETKGQIFITDVSNQRLQQAFQQHAHEKVAYFHLSYGKILEPIS